MQDQRLPRLYASTQRYGWLALFSGLALSFLKSVSRSKDSSILAPRFRLCLLRVCEHQPKVATSK